MSATDLGQAILGLSLLLGQREQIAFLGVLCRLREKQWVGKCFVNVELHVGVRGFLEFMS